VCAPRAGHGGGAGMREAAMSTWESIAWFPICLGLTVAGAALSVLLWRRSGVRRGLRGMAWSGLPLALYLSGAIIMVGRIGSAVVQFASGFVFSPRTWAGLVLFGVAGLTFLGTGGLPLMRRRRARKAAAGKSGGREGRHGEQELTAGQTGTVGTSDREPVGATKASKRGTVRSAVDDDLKDVEDILRKHGIT
jgi:hypothetical protein